MRKKILVETDFLFGLNSRDRLYPIVMEILKKHRDGEIELMISSAAPLEASLVLLSRGFQLDKVVKILGLMSMKLAEYRVDHFIPIRLEIVVKALELRSKYDDLTFFDSIHIALAAVTGFTLLTSDERMKEVMRAEGITYLDYHGLRLYNS